MKRITIEVHGMKCSMCEAHVNDSIRKSCKIKKVKSNHKKNQTIVIADDSIDLDIIRKAIENQGYTVENMTLEDYVKKGLFW